jgi:hypothetical protein
MNMTNSTWKKRYHKNTRYYKVDARGVAKIIREIDAQVS